MGRGKLRLVAQDKIQGTVESQEGPKEELASRKRGSSPWGTAVFLSGTRPISCLPQGSGGLRGEG